MCEGETNIVEFGRYFVEINPISSHKDCSGGASLLRSAHTLLDKLNKAPGCDIVCEKFS